MIYWFSGTGNSRFAATELARISGDNAVPIVGADHKISCPTLGIVSPVYSWGVPPIVRKFIADLSFERRPEYIWVVFTCGDETGLAPEMIKRDLSRRGLTPNAVFSVIMPNNYVLLPGFDVDPKEVEKRKLREAPASIETIARQIAARENTDSAFRGSMAALKTRLVYPLFRRWGIFPKKWRSGEKCIHCGKCAAACPVDNIEMRDGRPQWDRNCTSCLGCYHVCPVHAVEYGSATRRKGQYFLK